MVPFPELELALHGEERAALSAELGDRRVGGAPVGRRRVDDDAVRELRRGGASPQPSAHVSAHACVPAPSTTSWHGVPHTSPSAFVRAAAAASSFTACADMSAIDAASFSFFGFIRAADSKLVVSSASRPCCARAVPIPSFTSSNIRLICT